MSASRSSLPCSTSCITAVQVKSFETEPGRNRVGLGIDRRALGDVGVAEAALGQDLAVLDDDHDRAGDVAGRERVGHVAVEPGVDVFGGELMCSLIDRGNCGRSRAPSRFLPEAPMASAVHSSFVLSQPIMTQGRESPQRRQPAFASIFSPLASELPNGANSPYYAFMCLMEP